LADLTTDGADYILFAFAYASEETGEVYFDADNQKKYDDNKAELQKLQAKGIKILISVGGYFHSDAFEVISKDSVKRQKFAKSVKNFMATNNFDGIDIDWEFKKCSEATSYTELVEATRKEIDQKIMSVIIFRRPERMACVKYEEINHLVNYYNLMSYSYSGYFSILTGFNAPLRRPSHEPCFLNIENSLTVLLPLGVDKSKLTIGLAFYGQEFGGTEGINTYFDKDLQKPIAFKDIDDLQSAKYDSAAASAYIHDQTTKTLTTFDDVLSIGIKCDYIVEEGYAGAMVWEIGQDNSNGDLLKKVKEKLKPASGTYYT
jgi:chitinase